MKNGPVVVFRVLAAMFVVLGSTMLVLHFTTDGGPHLIAAMGPFIMSFAMFILSRNFTGSQD
jgi:hypothetical protein